MKKRRKLIWSLAGVAVLCFVCLLSVYAYYRLTVLRAPLPEKAVTEDIDERFYRHEAGFAAGKMAAPPAMAMASTGIPAPQVAQFLTAIKVSLPRKLIREAWLTLRVQDVPETAQKVRQVTEQLGGYVAEASQSRKPEGEWDAELVLRVPSERYNEAISQLQGLGQVENLRESVQDVTEEFIDLEARLRNLKRSEQHLLELLKRTGKVSDLLQVERELSNRRSEIEQIEGRLRYLSHQSDFSTIRVTLQEFRARPMPETAFSITKIFADAFRTVVVVLRIALVIAIWVLVFGIIWIPIAVVALSLIHI